MTYRGYLAREIDADEAMVDDLREFATHPSCPPSVRENVLNVLRIPVNVTGILNVLHEHEMAKRAVQTMRARKAMEASLIEIEIEKHESVRD